MEAKMTIKESKQTPLKQDWVLVFVAFFPEQDFFDRLKLSLDHGYAVIVFENTPLLSPELDLLKLHPGFTLLYEGNNRGLGYGMKKLMQQAYEMGFLQAVYFDQDTLFSPKSLQWIDHWIKNNNQQLPQFAAVQFAPNTDQQALDSSIEQTYLLINSGCLFSLDNLEKTGWHDEKYFVEGVDYKFCLDAAAKGFLLGKVNACPDIDHEAAQPMRQRTVFGREFSFRLYPAKRQRRFLAVLFKLAALAAKRGQWRYVWIFTRNIATHLVSQTAFLFLNLFPKADKQAKSGTTKTTHL